MMMGNFEGMAPEDIFAMGIKKGLDMVKDLGRNGDSELAHVNPEEKAMLESQGGAGTRNPQTGMPEYFGSDMEGERGRDTGVGGRDSGAAGGGSRSDMERERGRQTGAGSAPAPAQRGDMETNRQPTGVGTNPTSAGGTVSDMDAQKSQTQSSPPDDRSLGERLAAGLEAAFSGPSFGRPTSRDPGFLGAAAGAFPGIGLGMGLTRGLQAMGFSSTADFGDPDADQRDGDILSPAPPKQQQQKPVQQQFPWSRPGAAPEAPMGLGFDAGMSPLQQRTAVATGGTNADAGVYRDPAIVDFYRNLALFDLTQPGGAPRSGANVTDIERQFVSQLGGQPGSDVQSFLTALAGL